MKKKTIDEIIEYVRANRKGSREAELENNRGFKSIHKVHVSKKVYKRKNKRNERY